MAAEQNRKARVYWRLDTREAIMEVIWEAGKQGAKEEGYSMDVVGCQGCNKRGRRYYGGGTKGGRKARV